MARHGPVDPKNTAIALVILRGIALTLALLDLLVYGPYFFPGLFRWLE